MTRARRVVAVILFAGCVTAPVIGAQAAQNATPRGAQQAYDNLEYRHVVTPPQAPLPQPPTGPERARAFRAPRLPFTALDPVPPAG